LRVVREVEFARGGIGHVRHDLLKGRSQKAAAAGKDCFFLINHGDVSSAFAIDEIVRALIRQPRLEGEAVSVFVGDEGCRFHDRIVFLFQRRVAQGPVNVGRERGDARFASGAVLAGAEVFDLAFGFIVIAVSESGRHPYPLVMAAARIVGHVVKDRFPEGR